jgi:hypothetical protein
MTPLLLASAFTESYARSTAFLMSIKLNGNIPFHPLVIPKDMPDYGMPGSIVQAGYFLDHIPECGVVIFTDADLIMHRGLDADEISFLSSLGENQIAACYNKHPNELFAEELPMLYMRPSGPPLGYDDVRVMNTGFVAAKPSAYRKMFEKFKELWPEFDPAFEHYAKIQLCMCAAVHRLGMEWVPVPSHICAHGHFGPAEGVSISRPPTFGGRIIAFDHRLTH